MTDIVDGVTAEETDVEAAITTLAATADLVGPRRVKTKDMEIESHPLDKLQAFQERNSSKPVGLGQMRYDFVKPKGGCCG